jgi:ATP-dependent DNA helicase PIF1
LNFTSDQLRALGALDSGESVFLTGRAGTGKSTVVNSWLNNHPNVPRLASTGIAAVNISGRTLHSFFGIGAPKNAHHAYANFLRNEEKVRARFDDVYALVIDEVSMIGAETFTAMEHICREVANPRKPWGGLQIVVVGDFYQLKPVEDEWPFLTDAWNSAGFNTVVLNEIMRTHDPDFIDVLNEVREGEISDWGEEYLNDHVVKDHKNIIGVRLFSKNYVVDKYNEEELNKIKGKVFEYRTKTATYTTYCHRLNGTPRCDDLYPCERPDGPCKFKYAPSEFEYKYLNALPIPGTLKLKIGAQLMVRRNHPDGSYINGTVGKLVDLSENALTLETENGIINVEKHTFEVQNGDGKVVFTGTNFPVCLAWASTLHKAQGRSLDSIVADLSNLFDVHMAYVGLSRARSGDGVHLIDWNLRSIKVDKRVKAFYKEKVRE